jgi:hypothetical protein
MVEQLTLQTLIMFIQAVGILVAVIYHIMTLQNTRKNQQLTLETRQAQLFMQVYHDFCTPEWWRTMGETAHINFTDYDVFEETWGRDTNLEGWSRQGALHGFFEGLGVLVYRKLIDPGLVDDLMSAPIIRYWERSRPMFLERRKRLNSPSIAEWIEYLYNQIRPIYDEQHPELKT